MDLLLLLVIILVVLALVGGFAISNLFWVLIVVAVLVLFLRGRT